MGAPVVDDSEHYNHEELVAQVRILKAQMRVVGTATEELLHKHNLFVADAEQGFGGLISTTSQQWQDMATLKVGCQVLESGIQAQQQRMDHAEHGIGVFRTEYGDKLDMIATAAQSFEQQVRDMEKDLSAKIDRVELETVPADLRRAHAGMSAELAKFRTEHSGNLSEAKVEGMIAEALGSQTSRQPC